MKAIHTPLALFLASAAACGPQLDPSGSPEPGALAETEGAISASNEIAIPLHLIILYDQIDPVTNLPGYMSDGRVETIRDIDAAIADANVKLTTTRAAAGEGRILRLVRASVDYVPAPTVCPDPVNTATPSMVYGALDVVMTGLCGGVTTASNVARASAGSLFHEVGHVMGLTHTFDRNTDPAGVELLERITDDGRTDSCYRRGDSVCDTPPDYGYVSQDGTQSFVVCSTLVPGQNLCTQTGGPCNPSDPIVDGTGVCSGGVRTYDPAALGLFSDGPGNVMAYWQQSFLTIEQFRRVHDYAQWRLRVPARIPSAEKKLMWNLLLAPTGDAYQLHKEPTNRNYALANARSVMSFRLFSPSRSLTTPFETTFDVTAAQGRRVFGVRLSGSATGVRTPSFRATITPPNGAPIVLAGSDLVRDASGFFVDEGLTRGAAPRAFRGRRAYGQWRLRLEDPAGSLSMSNLTISVITGDRGYLGADRRARGLSDVMVYRHGDGKTWVSDNLGTGGFTMASGLWEGIRAPWAQVVAGDLDGDGAVDLLSRNGASISVAFNERSYSEWRPGWIDGSDRPTSSEEVLIGDFDGDGFGDLMRRAVDTAADRGVWKYHRGRGDGTFDAAVAPSFGGSNRAYVANVTWTTGDFDGDGRTDVMVRYKSNGQFWISSNLTARPGATPSFFGGVNPTIGGSPFAYLTTDKLTAMDINGDGRDDIVVRRQGTGEWIASVSEGPTQFAGGVWMTIGGAYSAYLDSDTVLGALP